MCCSRVCAALPCRRPTWRMPAAALSAASCSRSVHSSPSASAASNSRWRRVVLTRLRSLPRIARLLPLPPILVESRRLGDIAAVDPAASPLSRLHPHAARYRCLDSLSATTAAKAPAETKTTCAKPLPGASFAAYKMPCEISGLEDEERDPDHRKRRSVPAKYCSTWRPCLADEGAPKAPRLTPFVCEPSHTPNCGNGARPQSA